MEARRCGGWFARPAAPAGWLAPTPQAPGPEQRVTCDGWTDGRRDGYPGGSADLGYKLAGFMN